MKWTDKEIETLKGPLTNRELAEGDLLRGRSYTCIMNQRIRLGIAAPDSAPKPRRAKTAAEKLGLEKKDELPRPEFGHLPLDVVDSGDWNTFGLVADTHLACKEERLGELHNQYDLFVRDGIVSVFHAGNMVDGFIPRINGDSVYASSVDGQCRYVIDNYPRRPGIITYFITGDDHEGWWMKEGFNFGFYLELLAREAGRADLRYIGHVEADVEIRSKHAKKPTIIKVQHPGGGSAYARSYAGQKQVECVPLNSEILTRTGWRTWDKVVVGEEVLGYSLETGRCKWTTLLAVHTGEASVNRYFNDQFSAVCTANHKWVQEVEQRAGPNKHSKIPVPYSRRYQELAPLFHTCRRARIVQTAQKRIVNKLNVEPLGFLPVWCPTTGLGTWVMRQGPLITITGNSLEGGEKPAILVQGHYHVSNYMNERNVHVIGLPGFKDQDVFARKKRLRMEVGGAIISFKVNPYDGSVTRCRLEFNRYFTRAYYKPYLKSDKTVLKGHLVLKP